MKIYTREDGSPDLDAYKGRTGNLNVDKLKVAITVTDARMRYGHLDLLVTPVAGEGQRWIEQHRVELSI